MGGRPGDDFNARASWAEILEPHGWTFVYQRGEESYWRRPGKREGQSASTNYAGSDLFYPFTTSTEFEPLRGHGKFSVFAALEFNNDYAAAARELRRQGYGSAATADTGMVVR